MRMKLLNREVCGITLTSFGCYQRLCGYFSSSSM